jgi:hypothetical protein
LTKPCFISVLLMQQHYAMSEGLKKLLFQQEWAVFQGLE